MERRTLEVSWVGLWRVLFFVALVAILYQGRDILLAMFLAVVISSGFDFFVDWLEKRGLPRTLGVILVFLIAAAAIVIILYAVVPFVLIDVNTVFQSLEKLKGEYLPELGTGSRTTGSAASVVNRISSQFLAGGASPLGVLSQVVGGVLLAISIIVSAFYLSLGSDGVERFIKAVFPADYEEEALRIYGRARRRIGQWFRAQILLSTAVGILVWVSLAVLGVRHAFLLGLLAGLFEIVPFVGPILSGAAAALSALTVSPALALYTIIVFILIQQIENNFLVPLLMGKSVELHPVIVIAAILIGAEVGGVLGMLVSIPAAALIQEILEARSYRKQRLRESALF